MDGTKLSLLGLCALRAVQNSPCLCVLGKNSSFFACRESFVPGWVCGGGCGESFVPPRVCDGGCWESFVPGWVCGGACGESFLLVHPLMTRAGDAQAHE